MLGLYTTSSHEGIKTVINTKYDKKLGRNGIVIFSRLFEVVHSFTDTILFFGGKCESRNFQIHHEI